MLPNIRFTTTSNGKKFLEEMAELAISSGEFDVKKHFDKLGFDGVAFYPRKPSLHENLAGALIMRPNLETQVEVEISASKWHPNPPTRAVYIDSARDIFGELIQVYNNQNSTIYKMKIETENSSKYKLSLSAEKLLDRFMSIATMGSHLPDDSAINPRDWERFYDFVKRARKRIPEAEICSLLMAKGFSSRKAHWVSEIYSHLWAFKLYNR
jgi:hypothetical protein